MGVGRICAVILTLVFLVVACDGLDLDVDPLTAPTTTAPLVVSTVARAATTTTTLGVGEPDLTDLMGVWTASLRRVGPYLIEMSFADAEAAVPGDLVELPDQDPACSSWIHHPDTGIADQLRLMVRAGQIVRVDVDGPGIRTLSGIGVGDTASAVRSTYAGNVVPSNPPEGEDADEYLTFIPDDESDLDFRIRFEIEDGVVSTYRVGVVPEVEWVGRCGD